MQLSAITPVLLTFNEAANIERSLAPLDWARRVVVVDSGSSDATAQLVGRFANTALYERPFDSHAQQWTYAVGETGIDTEWILVLDADHIVTEQLRDELQDAVIPDDIAGLRVGFAYCLDGRPLRASIYPPAVVLFRRGRGRFVQDGHTQRLICDGKVMDLQHKLLHDDRKSTERWLQSQARYMTLEVAKLDGKRWRELDWPDRLRRLWIAAPAVFVYCLFGKGLLFDGKAGLLYTLQRTTAEAILSMILLRRSLKRLIP